MELGRKTITWTAIHKYDNGTTLYLCDSVIRHMAFSEYGNNDWEESDIRRWLNNEFLQLCFNDEERAKIINHSETGDSIFLLSKEEYRFCRENDFICDKRFSYEEIRGFIPLLKSPNDWWLRSKGVNNNYSCLVSFMGEIYHYGNPFHDNVGVRPAILVRE